MDYCKNFFIASLRFFAPLREKNEEGLLVLYSMYKNQ